MSEKRRDRERRIVDQSGENLAESLRTLELLERLAGERDALEELTPSAGHGPDIGGSASS